VSKQHGWGMVAMKRKWVPEWLWALACKCGHLPLIYPFRWIFTTTNFGREPAKPGM